VINGDDPWGRRLIEENPEDVLTFGLDGPRDIRSEDMRTSLQGIEGYLRIPGKTLQITSTLIGRFNIYNIMAAAGAAYAIGIDAAAIELGIASIQGIPGRMEKVSRAGEPHVFVDYAHTDDALRKAIENLSGYLKGRLITVFGCGGDRDQGKRPLMGFVAATLGDTVIVTSDNPRSEDPHAIIRQIEEGIRRKDIRKVAPADLPPTGSDKVYAIIPDRRTAIETAVRTAKVDDIVLIAGKGHEDYQIVGHECLHFDDRIVARESLVQRNGGA